MSPNDISGEYGGWISPDPTPGITPAAPMEVKEQWLAVNNPDTAAHILDFIVETGPHPLLVRVAEHPSASEETLRKLAEHPHPDVRAAVIENASTPKEVVASLSKDCCVDVRYALAESYVIDIHLLAQLLEDENPYVAHRARATLLRRNVTLVFTGTDFTASQTRAVG